MLTVEQLPERPGLVGFRLAATGSVGLDWQRLDETWALAGELDVFDAGWMSDHLSDASRERGGPRSRRSPQRLLWPGASRANGSALPLRPIPSDIRP
jgi:hypothetical protein